MKCNRYLVVLILLSTELYVPVATLLFDDFTATFASAVFGVKFTKFNVTSFMKCAAECMKRKMCGAAGHDTSNYQCGFVEKEKYRGVMFADTCLVKRDLISKYPKALAGACSDHNCTKKQTCEPIIEGGYRCTNNLRLKMKR